MPMLEPVHIQKLRTPGAGPTSGLESIVCEMAPFTTRMMPASAITGMRCITCSDRKSVV